MIVTARRVQREDPLGSIRIGAGGALEILEGDTVKATREDLVVTRVVWISRRVRVRSLRLSWPGRKPFVLAPAASGDWPGGGTLETTRQPDVIVSRLEWRKVLSALGIDDA